MSERNWVDAAPRAIVPNNDVVAVVVGEREIALYGINGEVFATDNVCSHAFARLCDGFLEGYEIECPLHQGRFDVRDGSATCEPAIAPIRSYPVKIESGRVWVAIDRNL